MKHIKHLDTIKTSQQEVENLNQQIDELTNKLANDIPSDNIALILETKDKIINLKSKRKLIQESDEVEYFVDTADILFKYYDLIEKNIEDGPVNKVDSNQKSSSILKYFINEDTSNAKEEEVDTRGVLLDKYLECVDKNHFKENSDKLYFEKCLNCGSQSFTWMMNEGYVICNDCHAVEHIIIDHEKPSYRDPPKEISYFAYKRINHLNEMLSQVQGKETTEIPDEIYESIIVEIKKQRISNMVNLTYSTVREILRKLQIHKYYEHIPHIIHRLNGIPTPHLPNELEEKLRNMFKQIQTPYLKYSPKNRKNFLSYGYVLYKLCQLLGQDQYLGCFKLLKTREKLHLQDLIWKKICNDVGWHYMSSL